MFHCADETSQEREAMYGSVGPSSPSSASARATQDRQSGNDRKRAEARRELDAARRHDHYESRRSLSEERYSEDEPPPPRYEDVVRQDARRAGNK